ncbi:MULTISPECIES: RagB/SusD family nutrient uptake outer membrane protein [Sphingobacterium]|uniref:RagB/SusD family nutrient uptake outer membrane protein n=1 Tax=Sphingobacterium populi TaxID=1812824 RepID=A0ABW5UEH7_9SPHI|nr:RagB/SusD family nutrient uptake outer membrane protein [Sphingobacterium sp. CFCC 11742]
MKNLSYKFTTACTLLLVVISVAISSCKKYIEVPAPKMNVGRDEIFADSSATLSAVLNLYENPIETLHVYGSLSSDEVVMPIESIIGSFLSAANTQANKLNIGIDGTNLTPNIITNLYMPLYSKIYNANICIEGITASSAYSTAYKNQLIAECKFWRAWSYYYLTNLWGNVPLSITSDVNVNKTLGNSTNEAIYIQIITDLMDARMLLSDVEMSTEKIRVNKDAVTAMLARVYFTQQNWPAAFAESNTLLSSSTYQLESNLNNVFLKTSRETIFQVQSVGNTPNITGATRIPSFFAPLLGFALNSHLSPSLLEAMESGDRRKTEWLANFIDFNTFRSFIYPAKYKHANTAVNGNEYYVMFRLAEQHLIRAEAAAHLNDFATAENDLFEVRNRAGLTTRISINDLPTALATLEQERHLELFTEWADRWINLKRTGRIDVVLPVTKLGITADYAWQPHQALYPFSVDDLRVNVDLKQNPGY